LLPIKEGGGTHLDTRQPLDRNPNGELKHPLPTKWDEQDIVDSGDAWLAQVRPASGRRRAHLFTRLLVAPGGHIRHIP
jgi:hypothetical protein